MPSQDQLRAEPQPTCSGLPNNETVGQEVSSLGQINMGESHQGCYRELLHWKRSWTIPEVPDFGVLGISKKGGNQHGAAPFLLF